MVSEKLNVNWFAYATVHLDKETAAMMKDAGCSRVGFGVESLMENTLRNYKPTQNLARIKAGLEASDSEGILNRGYFIIGFPTDTKESLIKTSEILNTLPIDHIRIGFPVPFVGTPLYYQIKDKIVASFEKHTGDVPVIKHPSLTSNQLIEIRDFMIKQFYNSDNYFEHVESKIDRFPYLTDSFRFFFQHLKHYNIIDKHSKLWQLTKA